MNKRSRITLIISLASIVFVMICWGAYLHFYESYTTFEALETVMLRIGSIVILMILGMIIGTVVLFMSNLLNGKQKK